MNNAAIREELERLENEANAELGPASYIDASMDISFAKEWVEWYEDAKERQDQQEMAYLEEWARHRAEGALPGPGQEALELLIY